MEEIFIHVLLEILSSFCEWKNVEDGLRFGKAIFEIQHHSFSRHSVFCMCEVWQWDMLSNAGIFYSAEEEQPGVISTRVPSRNHDYQLVVGGEVYTSRPV